MNFGNMFKKKVPRAELFGKIEALEVQLDKLGKQYQELEKINKANEYKGMTRGSTTTPQKDFDAGKNFYAGVINITHIRNLQEGWEVKINDWKQFLDLAKKSGVIVTVVGNYNKGKTFLFELLSGTKMPYGFNTNTQGISIVYLNDKEGAKDTPVIGLDTRGGALPLDLTLLRRRLNELDVSKSFRGTMLQKQDEKEKEEEDLLRQILRDHEATEDIIQNFILEEASLIVVMVSDLTFEDQKLVNKIKKKFKNDGTKKIVVVHNLYHTHYKADIEYKISEFITRSFLLQKENFTYVLPDKNRIYFTEKFSKQGLIPHVILAKQDTEAGDFYNEATVRYIRSCILANDKNKSINVVDAFYKYLQKNLFTYVKCLPELAPEDIKLEKDQTQKPIRIFLDTKESLEMKAASFDEFGHLNILTDEFQPPYSINVEYVSDTEKYFCLKVECPDCHDIKDNILSRVYPYGDEFTIQVKGKKKEYFAENVEPVADHRHFGGFCIETDRYKRSEFNIPLQETAAFEYIDGMAIFKWRLLPQEDGWKLHTYPNL